MTLANTAKAKLVAKDSVWSNQDLVQNQGLAFFSFPRFGVLPFPLWATVQPQRIYTHLGVSPSWNIYLLSLRVKMKRSNIDLFIPSYKYDAAFDLLYACVRCKMQQRPDWNIIFIKWMAPPQTIAVVKRKWNKPSRKKMKSCMNRWLLPDSKPDAVCYRSSPPREDKTETWCLLLLPLHV